MTTWFLAFLGLIWIAVFVPGAVRARRRTPLPAAMRFRKAMSFIAPPKPGPRHLAPRPESARRATRTDSGRWIIVPHSDERTKARAAFKKSQQRRRHVLLLLGLAGLGSALAALLRGGAWFEIHLMIDAIVIFYVAMLFEAKRRRDERGTKVRSLVPESSSDVQDAGRQRAGGIRY